uniref:Calcium binding protein 7 n=1 Tax=Suricata suricatta TaxID=37032 RepID=A0A673TPN8_SURSU
MPFHPVTAALMYRGIYTVPNLLSEQRPVDIPEDELEEIREAFKVFDRDGNGFISKQELGTAMRSLGYMPNEVELEVIIQRLDMDGDGQVDFEEFVTLLGPKLSTSGIPEKFHGTDFDTVFWKVCTGWWGPRVCTLWSAVLGPVNSQAHAVKGDDHPKLLSTGCLVSQGAMGSLGGGCCGQGLKEWSEWFPVLQSLEACHWACVAAGCCLAAVVVTVARALCLLLSPSATCRS